MSASIEDHHSNSVTSKLTTLIGQYAPNVIPFNYHKTHQVRVSQSFNQKLPAVSSAAYSLSTSSASDVLVNAPSPYAATCPSDSALAAFWKPCRELWKVPSRSTRPYRVVVRPHPDPPLQVPTRRARLRPVALPSRPRPLHHPPS